jgi:hypothetical protein
MFVVRAFEMSFTRDPRTLPALSTVAALFVAIGLVFVALSDSSCSTSDLSELPALSLARVTCDYFVNRDLDTLFVLDSLYIEVRLDSQMITVHSRHGSKQLPCSTGNKKIPKALETTEGIFTVQGKSPLAYSRQFDSTKMFHWVGFNGNIGFHGLEGRSYYRFLGKRPSSHGCIRMAREDAEWMFRNIPLRTPVIVHYGSAARTLSFADSTRDHWILLADSSSLKRGVERRLAHRYAGRALLETDPTYYFQHSTLWWGGMTAGDITRVPKRQQLPGYVGSVAVLSSRDILR